MVRKVLLGMCLVLSVESYATAQNAPVERTKYDFTTILNSKRDRLEPTRCAAMNSQGIVAVQVRDRALGINRLITKGAANDAPLVIADTRSIPDFPTFCDNGMNAIPSDPTINELGEVAFQGNLRRLTTRADCGTTEQRARRQGVFLGGAGRSPPSLTPSIRRAATSFRSFSLPISQ
jgi:hypothetical protein